jgi:tRNA threonylcarbamoyladenosine biosynthesis protein TsaB
MRVLAVDTSTDSSGVVLWTEGSCVVRLAGDEPSRHAETLLPLIDRAFSTAGWTKGQLDLVACCIGPGSFTGVRVGLSTAKGIALALDRPIVGIGSLQAMATAARAGAGKLVLALLEARQSEVFWAMYEGEGELVEGPSHVKLEDVGSVLLRMARRSPLVVGAAAAGLDLYGAPLVRGAATDRPDAAEVARIAVDKFTRVGGDELHALEPHYVRPPDITLPSIRPHPPRN